VVVRCYFFLQAGVWGVAIDPSTRVYVLHKHIWLLSLYQTFTAKNLSTCGSLVMDRTCFKHHPLKAEKPQTQTVVLGGKPAPMRIASFGIALTSWGLRVQIGGLHFLGNYVDFNSAVRSYPHQSLLLISIDSSIFPTCNTLFLLCLGDCIVTNWGLIVTNWGGLS
jgi:hypothetical protein